MPDKDVIDDQDQDGHRSLQLYLIVSHITGLTANEVRARIVNLAN